MPHCLLCTEDKRRLVVLHPPAATIVADMQLRATVSVHSACDECISRLQVLACPWCRFDLAGQQPAAYLEGPPGRCGQALAVKSSQTSVQYRFCTIAPGDSEFCHVHRGVMVPPDDGDAMEPVPPSHVGGMPLTLLQDGRMVYEGVAASVSNVIEDVNHLAEAGAESQAALHGLRNQLHTDTNQFRVLTALATNAPFRVQNQGWAGLPAAGPQGANVVLLTGEEARAEANAIVARWA